MNSISTPNGKTVAGSEIPILAGIRAGANRWSRITTHYFGVARLKGLPGRTAVHQKLVSVSGKGFVEKTEGTYSLTNAGEEALQAVIDSGLDPLSCKSEARKKYEDANPDKVLEFKELQDKFNASIGIATEASSAAETSDAEVEEEVEA